MHEAKEFLDEKTIEMLKRQHYALFGHSAVKLCHWTKASIYKGEVCYKQKFYGIKSHRCLQMTPSVSFCDQKCVFCWRPFTEQQFFPKEFDGPKEVLDAAIEKQRMLLTGYGEFREQIGEKKLTEANNPNQVAISLSGEPTLYPKLSEFVEECSKRKMTSFLVSNALHPEVLGKMFLPTQLYLSLEASSKELHKKINCPLVKDSWKRIIQSLELLPSLDTRTCIRITLIKGKNMSRAKEFAELIKKAEPDFVELKAYMFVGYSRKRLLEENMPFHSEVKAFAEKLNKHLNYTFAGESIPSRVVLLEKGSVQRLIKN